MAASLFQPVSRPTPCATVDTASTVCVIAIVTSSSPMRCGSHRSLSIGQRAADGVATATQISRYASYRPLGRTAPIGTYVGNRVKRFRDMWVIGGHLWARWLRSMSIWKRLTRWCWSRSAA